MSLWQEEESKRLEQVDKAAVLLESLITKEEEWDDISIYLGESGANEANNKEYLGLKSCQTKFTFQIPQSIKFHLASISEADLAIKDSGILAEFELAYMIINKRFSVWSLN